ncbi:MAG: winged helix-turn-helix domain-containing protein [Anaerolineae bacterium]
MRRPCATRSTICSAGWDTGRNVPLVTFQALVRHLRDYKTTEREASILLRSHIHRLRCKIEPEPAQPQLIQSVRGRGYRFNVPSDTSPRLP